jgi:aminoglycoside phosphotransferase (APT) family kinase protein
MQVEPRLRAWIENVALPGRTVVDAQSLTGGYSNDNRLITTADGGRFVLRRYLGGNACAVEAALAARLAGIVPVPEVIAADPDGGGGSGGGSGGADAGEPVLLSVFAPGRPLGDVLAAATGPEAAELGRETGRVLAAIGSVEFAAPGFFSDASLEPGPPGMEPTSGVDAFVERCLKEGNAAGHLGEDEQRALLRFATEAAPDLAVLHGSRRLVHADFNPKNLLAVRSDGRWRLSAVLDWEFAFSSSPLFDVGNMLRDPRPAGFGEAFVDGFRAGGGELPDDWRRLSRALDLYSLADLLKRPADHRYFRRAVQRIRALIAT